MIIYELREPALIAHLTSAIVALLIGITIMLRRKGTLSHKTMGWIFTILMATVAISAIQLRSYHGVPNFYGFTPIHLFVILVLATLPRAVWAIYHGDRIGHGKGMRGLFYGALIGAGIFTLLPGRLLGYLLWHRLLGLG